MRYKLLIFDFDGTLADSFPWFLSVFNDVADRYRFRRIRDGELEELRGLGGRELMKRLGAAPWKAPFIANHMRGLKERDLHTIALFPGVDAMLRGLSAAGVRLALVTSNSDVNARRILGPANVALLDHIECGASLFGKKGRFLRVLRRAGVAPGEALCVGDELRDLEAAAAAGIPFGAVTWGYTTAEALRARRPAELFSSVGEILEVVTGERVRG